MPSENAPATQTDFRKAERLLNAALAKPLNAVDPEEVKKLSIVQRRVRTELFQRSVRMAYANACAFCGMGMLHPPCCLRWRPHTSFHVPLTAQTIPAMV